MHLVVNQGEVELAGVDTSDDGPQRRDPRQVGVSLRQILGRVPHQPFEDVEHDVAVHVQLQVTSLS